MIESLNRLLYEEYVKYGFCFIDSGAVLERKSVFEQFFMVNEPTHTGDKESNPLKNIFDGFLEPFWLDRTRSGSGVMIYVEDNVSSKSLTKHFCSNNIEGLFVELNFRISKWLLIGIYHPPSQ